MVALAAIRIAKMAAWRVDGLSTISAGSSRNHGPPIRHFPVSTTQTLIAAKGGSDLINFRSLQGMCVNGARNTVY